ncbi:uncharacterized protein LOC134348046 [Mobula hypostoma]|uniref:uncharacterized protein LOC134348046 n=1 Tax=Mobula hypostoma TaxID=723540 RepID=UPI002FC3218E
MDAFKMPSAWQGDIAKNLSNIFSSNKSPEEGSPAKNAHGIDGTLNKETTESPTDGKTANMLFSDLAKGLQTPVDQETSSSQEKQKANETVVNPDNTSNNMKQPDDGILQKLGSFFSWTPKSNPITLPQSKNESRSGLNTGNQYRTHTPHRNNYSKGKPFREQTTQNISNDSKENDRNTLERSHPENPSTGHRFVNSQPDDLNKIEIVIPKEKTINSTPQGQSKESRRSVKKPHGSSCSTDPTTYQKLQKFNGSMLVEGDIDSNKKAVDDKTPRKLQTVAGKCKENNRHLSQNGTDESTSSEDGKDAFLTPIVTYSTYQGARRMRRRRPLKKVFSPLTATITEEDEKNATSSANQQIKSSVEEETNQDSPTMTQVQRPLEEKLPSINHDSEKNEDQYGICTERCPSIKTELLTDLKTESEIPAQQSSFIGMSSVVELKDQQKEETASRTDTMESTTKQALQLDTSPSNGAGKSFRTDSGEHGTHTGSATIGSKLKDAMKQTERTEYVGEDLAQEIANQATAPTKSISLTEPVDVVHMNNEVDIPKILLIDRGDKCDVQLKDASGTQTNKRTMVSGKDNITGISTGLFTSNTENTIEKPSREHNQMEGKTEADIKHVNTEQFSDDVEKLMNKNSSIAELMNETKSNKNTTTNIDGVSTKTFEIPGETVFTITSEKASSVIMSPGIRSSEAFSTNEPQKTTDGNCIQTEKSFYIQNPAQLFNISSKKKHDLTSESFLSDQAPLTEPKVSRGAKLSLPCESIFYRYYQESANLLLDSDNRQSLANTEIIAKSPFKESKFVGEMQSQRKALDSIKAQNDSNEKAKETSCTSSPAANNLCYRYLQQISSFSNTGRNVESEIDSDTHLENPLDIEIVHSTKLFASVANSADKVIQDTSEEYALNDSKVPSEEMARRTKTSESEDSAKPFSVKLEGKESTLKVSAEDKKASIHSEEELESNVYTVAVSSGQPVETNSGDTLKESSKETAGKLIFSAERETPCIQPITTDSKENSTTEDRVTNLITFVNVKDTVEEVDFKDSFAEDHPFEEIPKKLEERVQVDGERRVELVKPESLENSGSNLTHSTEQEDKSVSLIAQDNVLEYVPSFQNAAKKDSSVVFKSQETGINSLPVLPMGIGLAPGHAAENVTNQEASTSLLKPNTTPASVTTESLLKADEDKIDAGQIQTLPPLEKTELRTEESNTVVGAEDSWPETTSKMASHNTESEGQELRDVSEQCSIIDPAQSTVTLRSNSTKLPQSNDDQGNSDANFTSKFPNSEEEDNSQMCSVQSEMWKSKQSGNQEESVDQNIKPKKEIKTVSEVKSRSKYPLLNLIKPMSEMRKPRFPKVALTNKETKANSYILGAAQLSSSNSGATLSSDSTMPSEANSAVDWESSPNGATPHTKHSNSEECSTIETSSSSHLVQIASLKDSKDVDLKENTEDLIANNMGKEIPAEFVKSVQVEVQEREVMQSEIQEQSDNNTMLIAEGEDNVKYDQIKTQHQIQGTEPGTDLRNIVVGAKDSWPETSLKTTQSDNADIDTVCQELIGIVSEQCNIIDPALSTAILKTNSAISLCLNESQENPIVGVETSEKHAKNENVPVQLSLTNQSPLIDQEVSTNLNTKSEGETVSRIKTISNYIVPELTKPVTEKGNRTVQKMALISKEIKASSQIPDETQLPSPDSGAVLETDSAIPPDADSAVDHVPFHKVVTPHTQHSNTAASEGDTTVETSSDLITITRLNDAAEDVELQIDTTNVNVHNNAKGIPKELVRTMQVSGTQEKEAIQLEIQQQSENSIIFIAEGEGEASSVITQGNISEYIPAVHSVDEKDTSTPLESREISFISTPALPVDNVHAAMEPDPDLINHDPNASLLDPTTSANLSDVTVLLLKAAEDKVNDGQVQIQQSIEGVDLRNELRTTEVGVEDSRTEISSNITKMANHCTDSVGQELTGNISEQCDIIDPEQSSARSRTDSNYSQESTFADFEENKSRQFAEHFDFTNLEEEEAEITPEVQADFDLEDIHLTNIYDGDVGEYIGEYSDDEDEMEPHDSEQEALILDSSLSRSFKRRTFYPFALPPIYEEQDLESDSETSTTTSNIIHSPTSEEQDNGSESVATVLESAATSVNTTQRENKLPEVQEDQENSTKSHSIGEVSTTVSTDHLEKETKISQDRSEEQNLPVQMQAEICVVDSNTSPKPMPSSEVGSILYNYFQLTKDTLEKVTPASSEMAAEVPTHLQQKPFEDVHALKYPSDSKCPVENKTLKINQRPGKMVIYDQLNFHGNKREIFTDQSDTTSWIFSEGLSLNVIRGCWIIYEKPEFQGQLLVLEEGPKELSKLWDNNYIHLDSTSSKIMIGSIKRIMKNHCIPEIEIIQEPQQQNVNNTYLYSEVACIRECGIIPTMSSLIVNSGIWLAYNKTNFCGPYTLLEAGSKPIPISTEEKSNDIKSLRPLKMGGLKVEQPMSPRIVIFEKEMFNGHFQEICKDIPDLKSLLNETTDQNVDNFRGAGSIRVIGGLWVCYEKKYYQGHQYLLEEGEYEDWQAWGGFDSTVQSLRYILADYMKPEITLFEEVDLKNGKSIVLNSAVPNLESSRYTTVTRSIKVNSGVWVAYHEEHYSGEQYILEKGVYRNHTSWGGSDKPIKSIHPIQLEPVGGNEALFQIWAYNGIDFEGESAEFVSELPSLLALQPNSFKVLHGCWVLYDEKDYGGCQYVLEEGHYPDLDSLGCLSGKSIRSLKPIISDFSIPSIGLYSLDSFGGQELILTEGASGLQKMGFYPYPNSVKVNGGTWIVYEHANFKGKQLVLQCSEITNWNKFSGWKTIGSLHPLKQPAAYFRIKNKATRTFVTVCGDSADPRCSKLSVCPYNGRTTQVWSYCNGLIKSKVNHACIDIIGGQAKAGTKINLWTEHGRNHQKWRINCNGTITSFLDLNLRLDIKGGNFNDKDSIILNLAEQQQHTQFWDIEMLR